jgi:hypothetical protein
MGEQNTLAAIDVPVELYLKAGMGSSRRRCGDTFDEQHIRLCQFH